MDKVQIIGYIYQYSITFCICLLGSFVKDAYDTIVNKTPIRIIRILISTLFSAFAMCALYSSFPTNFSVYVFLSFFSGLWGFTLIQFAMNFKIIFVIFKNIFSEVSGPIFKGIGKGMQEIQNANPELELDNMKISNITDTKDVNKENTKQTPGE